MRTPPRAFALAAVALTLVRAPLWADRFEDSLAAATANLATPEGRAYGELIAARFDERKLRDGLSTCAESAKEEDLSPFTVVMEIAGDGRPAQVLLRPPTPVAICLRWSVREATFQKPPAPAYWVSVFVDPKRAPGAPMIPTPGVATATVPPTRTPVAPPPAAAPTPAVSARSAEAPIIDMHMHAFPDGPRLAREGLTEKTHRDATLEAMKKHNIVKAFVSGTEGSRSLELLERWRQAAPDRIVVSMGFHLDDGRPDPAALRRALAAGKLGAIGEILAQYDGIAPDDEALEPYWALAEELEVPVGIHMGLGPPGIGGTEGQKYRASLGNPLLLEKVIQRHPKLRVYVMHAGWPMLDEMLALLWTYPQVYVDTGVIAWALPRSEFHRYLRQLVEAGFGDRVMFGSDQMEFVGEIGTAIEAIRSADFLTPEQKRDILYGNAARFLRLPDAAAAAPSR